MAIYRFNSSSLIDEVRVIKNSAGGLRANLHARADATPEELAGIQANFIQQGYKCVPISENGAHYLEVRGLKNSDQFLTNLRLQSLTEGTPALTKTPDDVITRKEKFRNMTLRGTGLIYNIGDIAYLTYAIRGFRKDKAELQKVRSLTEAGVVELNKELAEKAVQKALKNKKTPGTYTPLDKAKFISNAEDAFKGAQLDVGGGVGYAIGGSVLSLFASRDQSQGEIKDDVKKIRQFMLKEDVGIPTDSAAHQITKKEQQSPLQKIRGFVAKHPSEVLNTVYTGVGILLASASIKKVQSGWKKGYSFNHEVHKDVRNDVKDIGLGAITMSSALMGLLVKEKKREPGQPKRSGFGGVWDWIQEKPLRATGVGYFISTLFHAWATVGKYKEGDEFVRKTVSFRAVFVGANILAEVLLFLSSKGHGQGVKTDESVERTVVATTAELIAKQPEEKQPALVQQLAGYMASPNILGGKAENIAVELNTQLAAIKQNPWAKPTRTHTVAPMITAAVEVETPSPKVEAASVQHSAPIIKAAHAPTLTI